jgi:hypothetical protein
VERIYLEEHRSIGLEVFEYGRVLAPYQDERNSATASSAAFVDADMAFASLRENRTSDVTPSLHPRRACERANAVVAPAALCRRRLGYAGCSAPSMRHGVVRSAAIITSLVWAIRTLGCDTSATKSAFVDTDGDGLSDVDELRIYGTSPVFADTDGDGMSDYEEIVLHAFNPATTPLRFNPRIADVPIMDLRITSAPVIAIRYTTDEGETMTYQTSNTFETGVAFRTSVTEQQSFANTVGGSETISREVTLEFADDSLAIQENVEDEEEADDPAVTPVEPPLGAIGFDPGGPNAVILSAGISSTVDWSNTEGVMLSFTAEQIREMRQGVTFMQSYSQSHNITKLNGAIKILGEIRNPGNVPWRLTLVVLSASLVGEDGVEAPIGNLDIDTATLTYNAFAIAPGAMQGPVTFIRDNLTLQAIEMMLDKVDAIKLRVGLYEMSDATGKSYVFDSARIVSRTATVVVDYGGQRPRERFLVATNVDPGHPGVTMERALAEILRLPYEADPERGLTSVRNISTPEPGHWTVELRHNESGEPVTTAYQPPYDFPGITLRAGDVMHLTWSVP